MSLSEHDITRLAERVETAQTYGHSIRKLTEDFPDMTVADGYRVQTALRRSFEARGHRVTGWKAGLTSKPKMRQMGVEQPSIGFLTDRMAVAEGGAISVAELVHPRVESEIAFVMKDRLAGAACTAEDVRAATDFVLPAIEIIDSRFTGFKFDLESVIGDNSSSARYVIGGRPRRLEDLDLRTIGTMLEVNGEIKALGAGAEVLNDPAEAIAMMVRVLDELGEDLPAGSLALSGAITAAYAVVPGDFVRASFHELGSVSVTFTE